VARPSLFRRTPDLIWCSKWRQAQAGFSETLTGDAHFSAQGRDCGTAGTGGFQRENRVMAGAVRNSINRDGVVLLGIPHGSGVKGRGSSETGARVNWRIEELGRSLTDDGTTGALSPPVPGLLNFAQCQVFEPAQSHQASPQGTKAPPGPPGEHAPASSPKPPKGQPQSPGLPKEQGAARGARCTGRTRKADAAMAEEGGRQQKGGWFRSRPRPCRWRPRWLGP